MKSHLIITVRLSEHLKCLRNVCYVMTNRDKDQETQASHKTVSYFFSCNATTGFVQTMENLESHGILQFHFPGLKSHGI